MPENINFVSPQDEEKIVKVIKKGLGYSLAVQQLGFHVSAGRGMGSIPG